jgi:hypothetical protein
MAKNVDLSFGETAARWSFCFAVHESAIGPKQTYVAAQHESAFGVKADIACAPHMSAFGSKADKYERWGS